MKTNVKNPVVATVVLLALTTVTSFVLADQKQILTDYTGTPQCFGTAGSTINGSLTRPTLPATISLGIILVEFSNRLHYTAPPDLPNGYLKQDFEYMLFSDDYYITTPQNQVYTPDGENVFGSLKDWFQENSHGLIQLTGQVINPADANGVITWLNFGSSAAYTYSRAIIDTAINRAVRNGWNCNYNVIAVVLSQGADVLEGSMNAWHGSGNYGGNSNFRIYASELPSGSPYFNYNNFMGAYTMQERWRGDNSGFTSAFAHIGAHTHEMYHILGFVFLGIWQDVWGPAGYALGDWSNMHRLAVGPLRKGECPSHLTAARKVSTGWATATDVNTNGMVENIQYINTQTDIPDATDFYRFTDASTGEEFIVENRQYTGFNSYLPAWWDPNAIKGGLLIFHTKPYSGGSNVYDRELMKLGDNVFTAPYYVGSSDPANIWSYGDPGDPFPGSSSNTYFTMASTPSSNTRAGNPTGFAITNISPSAATMTATFYKSYLVSNSTEATAFNNSRRMSRDSGGSYHFVFETGGEIYYQYSMDGGSTWSRYRRLSAGNGNNKYPALTERSGHIYMVWQRRTGTNQYAILFRHSGNSGTSWDDPRTITSNLSQSSDPLPVIAASTPGASFEMMVAYRTAIGLKSRRSTSTSGSSWQSEITVTGNTSARNPSLIYKSGDYGYFNITWDNGSQVYHQIFQGSNWSSAVQVSQAWTNNNQYSCYSLAGNLDRHIVWQAQDWSHASGKQVIMHNKNLNPSVYSEFYDYRDYLRPTGSGHSGGAFSVIWHDAHDAKNIRKAYYNGSSWADGQFGVIIGTNGADASLSLANPPGATAKAVWRSAGSSPYTLTLGPSGGLGKVLDDGYFTYNRRIAYAIDSTSVLSLQTSTPELFAAKTATALSFPDIADDKLLVSSQLPGAMTISGIHLPTDADSLVFTTSLYYRQTSALCQDQKSSIEVKFELIPDNAMLSSQTIRFQPVSASDAGYQLLRASFPVADLRDEVVTLGC